MKPTRRGLFKALGVAGLATGAAPVISAGQKMLGGPEIRPSTGDWFRDPEQFVARGFDPETNDALTTAYLKKKNAGKYTNLDVILDKY